jgi:thiamine kinase-like enzyme
VQWATSRFSDIVRAEKKLYEEYVSRELFNFIIGLEAKIPAIMQHLGTKNRTFIHGDAWVNNWLFEDNKKPILIDWQTCCLGNGLYDLATAIFSCLTYWYKNSFVTSNFKV